MHSYVKSEIKIKSKNDNKLRCVYYRINNDKIDKITKFIKKNNQYVQVPFSTFKKSLSKCQVQYFKSGNEKLHSQAGGMFFDILKKKPKSNLPKLPPLNNDNKFINLPNVKSPTLKSNKLKLTPLSNTNISANNKKSLSLSNKRVLPSLSKKNSENSYTKNTNSNNSLTYSSSLNNSLTYSNSLNNSNNYNNTLTFLDKVYGIKKPNNAISEFNSIIKEKKKSNPKYLENVERLNRIKSNNISY